MSSCRFDSMVKQVASWNGINVKSMKKKNIILMKLIRRATYTFYTRWALRNFPVRNNPERNIPESRKSPKHIHKSRI
jgi:hypothetical protein